jgi:prepilin-type N-terminal cleavage/methylation domain-containing protein
MRKRGFTLIELLIVIAIILILIAIALPNFLEAQIRAKTAKAYGEMRSLATAIEALRTERGVLLIDFGRWIFRLANGSAQFAGVGHWIPPTPTPDGRSMECVLYPLTTPSRILRNSPG